MAHFTALLDAAIQDDQLPAHLRDAAVSLRPAFPGPEDLKALTESGRQGLPAAVADNLRRAVIWLRELGRCRELPPDLRRWWVWMDRHFPTEFEVEAQREAASHPASILWPPIGAWLQVS